MVADESHDCQTQAYIILTKGTMVSHYRIIKIFSFSYYFIGIE